MLIIESLEVEDILNAYGFNALLFERAFDGRYQHVEFMNEGTDKFFWRLARVW